MKYRFNFRFVGWEKVANVNNSDRIKLFLASLDGMHEQ